MSESRLEHKGESSAVVKKRKIEIADAQQFPAYWPQGSGILKFMDSFFITDQDAAHLAQTCRFWYHGTKDPLNARKQKVLKQLAHDIVVEPNEDKVVAMLRRMPKLVMDDVVIESITNNSNQELVNNTLFQLAFCAGDDEMCLAMKPFFIQIYGSEKAAIQEMDRQRAAKIPEDKNDAIKDKEISDHFAALLKPVVEAITNEEFKSGKDKDKKWILTQNTLDAIHKFREEFAKSQPKCIEKGMHFRNNTLLETYNAYVQAAAQWNYDYTKCALFEDGILSSVLFYAPANDAERFSQGLYYLQRESQPEKFNRSLALRVGKNNFYLELRGNSSEFAFVGSFVDIVFGGGRGTLVGVARFIKTYVEQKRQTCRAYAICRTTPEEVSVRNFLK